MSEMGPDPSVRRIKVDARPLVVERLGYLILDFNRAVADAAREGYHLAARHEASGRIAEWMILAADDTTKQGAN